MTNESENIELRSEKIRNIIGQIPPILIRGGISIIFIVFVIVIISSYFFKYDYVIKTTAEISMKNDSVCAKIMIPANQIGKARKGQTVEIFLDKIPNLYGQIIKVNLQEISTTIQVSRGGGNYVSELLMPKNLKTLSGVNLEMNLNIILNAEIQVGKIRLFNRILDPLLGILKRRKLQS